MMRASDAIVVCVFGLLSVGVVMVNSAGMSIDPDNAVTFQSVVFSRSTLFMALACIVLLLVRALPIRRWITEDRLDRFIPLLLLPTLILLALVYAPVIGHSVNGAARWLRMPGTGLQMQPSEVAKWVMPAVLAWYITRQGAAISSFTRGLLPGLLLLGIVAAIITVEDLGTGVLLFAAGCVVLWAGGAAFWQFLACAPLPLVGIVAAVLVEDYRQQRILTFLDPFRAPDAGGYHIIQSMVAIANGQGFGRGLGFGLQKFGYLPEDRTDFLFAVICEELGLAGAVLVIALYTGLLLAGLTIIRRERHLLLKLYCLGVLTTFAFQALMNLMVVTNLAPAKGIALPLLSSGGTGWILTAAALGLVAAVGRSQPLELDELAQPETNTSAAVPA